MHNTNVKNSCPANPMAKSLWQLAFHGFQGQYNSKTNVTVNLPLMDCISSISPLHHSAPAASSTPLQITSCLNASTLLSPLRFPRFPGLNSHSITFPHRRNRLGISKTQFAIIKCSPLKLMRKIADDAVCVVMTAFRRTVSPHRLGIQRHFAARQQKHSSQAWHTLPKG